MDIQLKHQPSYAVAVVRLEPRETIKAESGAMVSYSDGITIETKSEGGFLGGLKRMVGGESFFQNTFTAGNAGGEILFAPTLPGDLTLIEITPSAPFMLQSGAFVAGESGVSYDTSWGGAKGFFGSGSLLLLKVTGQGTVLASCFGAIETRELRAGERYTVDTGHIVGFDASIQFSVKRVGGWKSTILSGEGLVCELTGPGRVLLQTRSEEAFASWIIARVPRQSSSS